MPISLDRALGIYPQALMVRAQRAQLLAANIANADTPNYKARDIDFRAAMQQIQAQDSSNKTQIDANGDTAAGGNVLDNLPLLYRVPNQSSVDGNTVDMQKEQVEFGQNAVRYQASLRFLDGRIKGLLTAIRGE